MTECPCGRATPTGRTLCPRCIHTLEHALVNISAHHGDLQTLRTRTHAVRYDRSGGTGGTKTMPLGVDLRFVKPTNADKAEVPGREGQATTLEHRLHSTLTSWTSRIRNLEREHAGPTCAIACLHTSCALIRRTRHPEPAVRAICAYLHRQQRVIVRSTWAAELLDDLLGLERALAQLVDIPAERWYAGKCSARLDDTADPPLCPYELYANPDKPNIRCRACGTEHDVAERRSFLLQEAKDVVVTATEAAHALIAWTDYDGSEKKLVDLIYRWRDRDRLEVQDVTSLQGRDRHLYRLGDIQDLLVEHAQREQSRRITKAG